MAVVLSETPIPESMTFELLGAYPKRLNLGLPMATEIVTFLEMGLMSVALTKVGLERIRERTKTDINREKYLFIILLYTREMVNKLTVENCKQDLI